MKLGTGVSNIMGFAGFASGASTTSYVLAGSFTHYLLDTYGPQKLKEVYSSLDFDEAYGKPLVGLENEWKTAIGNILPELTRFDSLRTRYYFDRQSILFTPCLRRVGKMNADARAAMEEGRYQQAEELYATLYRENGSVSALRGSVLSMLRRSQFDRAGKLLDTAMIGLHPQAPSLYLYKGDIFDSRYYDTLLKMRLSSGNTLAAFARKYVPEKEQYLKRLYSSRSVLGGIPFLLNDTAALSPEQYVASLYLTAESYLDEGMLSVARKHYRHAIMYAKEAQIDDRIRGLIHLRLFSIDPYSEVLMDPDDSDIVAAMKASIQDLTEYMRRARYLRKAHPIN